MNLVISGLGEVGLHMAKKFSSEGHAVSVIDLDSSLLRELEESVDAKFVSGSSTSLEVLREAGADQADIFLALTSDDAVNLLSASVAKQVGAKRTIARCHAATLREYRAEGILEKLGIDDLISPELIAASVLGRQIRSQHSPVLGQFALGAVDASAFCITERSQVLGKKLISMGFPAGLRLGFVIRNSESLLPTPDFELLPGDIAVVFGKPEQLGRVGKLLDAQMMDRKKIKLTIYGADDVGEGIVAYFPHEQAEIKVIDPSETRLQQLLRLHPRVKAVVGEATDPSLLIEESVLESDYFLACTRHDENNVMACLQAVKLGVSPVMLVIHRPDYAGVLSDLGDLLKIDAVVSPRVAVADELSQFVSQTPYRTLWSSLDRKIEVIHTIFRRKKNLAVRNLGLPQGVLVLSVDGASGSQIPNADEVIHPGDGLTLLLASQMRNEVLGKIHEGMNALRLL